MNRQASVKKNVYNTLGVVDTICHILDDFREPDVSRFKIFKFPFMKDSRLLMSHNRSSVVFHVCPLGMIRNGELSCDAKFQSDLSAARDAGRFLMIPHNPAYIANILTIVDTDGVFINIWSQGSEAAKGRNYWINLFKLREDDGITPKSDEVFCVFSEDLKPGVTVFRAQQDSSDSPSIYYDSTLEYDNLYLPVSEYPHVTSAGSTGYYMAKGIDDGEFLYPGIVPFLLFTSSSTVPSGNTLMVTIGSKRQQYMALKAGLGQGSVIRPLLLVGEVDV